MPIYEVHAAFENATIVKIYHVHAKNKTDAEKLAGHSTEEPDYEFLDHGDSQHFYVKQVDALDPDSVRDRLRCLYKHGTNFVDRYGSDWNDHDRAMFLLHKIVGGDHKALENAKAWLTEIKYQSPDQDEE